MQIVEVNVNDLKEYENNPRFNDDAVEYVARSIEQFGFKVPCVIDSNNVIVTGHMKNSPKWKLKNYSRQVPHSNKVFGSRGNVKTASFEYYG